MFQGSLVNPRCFKLSTHFIAIYAAFKHALHGCCVANVKPQSLCVNTMPQPWKEGEKNSFFTFMLWLVYLLQWAATGTNIKLGSKAVNLQGWSCTSLCNSLLLLRGKALFPLQRFFYLFFFLIYSLLPSSHTKSQAPLFLELHVFW